MLKSSRKESCPMSVNSIENKDIIVENATPADTESAQKYHPGRILDSLPRLTAVGPAGSWINLFKLILNPPDGVPCYSRGTCPGPHLFKSQGSC
ncbi:MAG TPA: hypothetical protein VJG66_03960 [Patescibacteria group bacterium]|nr:hypothetical protein [Patescibacteria group bacterium]